MPGDFNIFDTLADALRPAIKPIVIKTALDIQALAQSKAPVDTGFLKNAIYAVTADGGDYGQATPTHKASYLLPQAGDANDTTAYVAAGANYSVYLEYGTRHQPAQPFFTSAIEETRGSFIDAMSKIEDKLKASI